MVIQLLSDIIIEFMIKSRVELIVTAAPAPFGVVSSTCCCPGLFSSSPSPSPPPIVCVVVPV